mmetsp:Transcript_20053/g.46701  ORF Transcript_20053/g.46701 Transcript_20053/m.46701 type:complete len:472 (-) Transcript_20053:36-1451(-)
MADAEWRNKWIDAVAKIRSDVCYEDSAAQLRALQRTGLLKLTDLKYNPNRFFEAHRLLARHAPNLGPGFWIRFTVHYNLFAGTVLAVGTEEQVKELQDIQQHGELGCFGLTEKLAGVNSGLVVQTVADWDDSAGEFVLSCPADGAHKNWISQGLVAERAVVVADLRIDGKSHGAHAFLVTLREGGRSLPNVVYGDMGQKTVGNDLDNAWIAFNGARIPKQALLSRYGEVSQGNGGKYTSKAKGFTNMTMIGQRLYTGRIAVAWAALTFTRKLFEMTHHYSDNKACWGPRQTSSLSSVPQLAALYRCADKKLTRLENFVKECERRLAECLTQDRVPPVELTDAIACAKIASSEMSIDLCFRLKQDVGSYALMGGVGFDQMDFLQACKFAEGDSRILMQKLARDRVKASKPVGSAQEEALAEKLRQALKKGGQQEWDNHFEDVYDLAWMIVTRIIDAFSPGDAITLPCGLSKL